MALHSPFRNILQEISQSPLVPRAVDSESNVALIPRSFLTPSPEEQIIQQRGQRHRHSLAVTTSTTPSTENIENERTRANETPQKFGAFLSAASRKRLLLTPPKDTSSPIKESRPAKKPRRASCPGRLSVELPGYSTAQLVAALDNLMLKHPHLEDEVRASLQSPDTRPLEEQLNTLQRNVYRSFPSTRWGSARDAYSYRRVRMHLDVFKKACVEQGRMLVRAQCWEAVLRYVTAAWNYVSHLPQFDQTSHNEQKQKCFRSLAAQATMAVKRGGLDREVLNGFKHKLEAASRISKEMEPCLKELEKILGK